jgi:hypothetical protein
MSEVSSAFGHAMTADVSNVSGAFKVRRSVTVSQFVRNIIAAVLADSPQIEVNGIIIHRPQSISIQVAGFREWTMTPDMPISVSALGTQISFDVSSVKLVTDDETGCPALLIATASRLKPDVIIVFDIGHEEVTNDESPSASELQTQFMIHDVPEKHQARIADAVACAWGPKQIAPVRMSASQGPLTVDGAERLAKLIVQDLVDQKVVSAGFFFWMQLGYWMVKIIAALIQARRGTQ